MVFLSDSSRYWSVLGLLNSGYAWNALAFLNPTSHIQLKDVKNIPAPESVLSSTELADLARLNVDWSASDWGKLETSFEFSENPLVAQRELLLRDAVGEEMEATFNGSSGVIDRERAIDRLVASEYGINDADNSHCSPRALVNNIEYRIGSVLPRSDSMLAAQVLVADLVSYAVGCMFGRYSLDEPGLILADQGATMQDYLAKVPQPTFAPDADSVLPIVDGDWFEDDIVARFRQFLRVAFGEEHFEENLRFVEESLGVKALREYFVTRAGRSKFYDDHVKRYKKRPIYWLFSSPKGSFNALIYMHRYTPSMVSTVLNEYLREFESKLEANLQHQERLAAGDGTPREKAAALKEAERLRKVLLELGEYEHDVLYPLASQQIAIDLDDGVKVNYPRFYPALKKIAGLEAADE